jgi:hypothetical protein
MKEKVSSLKGRRQTFGLRARVLCFKMMCQLFIGGYKSELLKPIRIEGIP